jgi:hypothetical protein
VAAAEAPEAAVVTEAAAAVGAGEGGTVGVVDGVVAEIGEIAETAGKKGFLIRGRRFSSPARFFFPRYGSLPGGRLFLGMARETGRARESFRKTYPR